MIDLRPAAVALLLAVAAGPVLAQETDGVISTRSTVSAPPSASDVDGVISAPSPAKPPPMTTDQKIANILSASWSQDQADQQQSDQTVGPRQIHGGGEVSVGTGGYRAASVYAIVPVGERGTVGVAYAQSQGGRGYVGGPGYGYGGLGYGYGGYGYGARGDGVSRSLALSFDFDASKDGARNCKTARDGGQPFDSQSFDSQWSSHIRSRPACDRPATE